MMAIYTRNNAPVNLYSDFFCKVDKNITCIPLCLPQIDEPVSQTTIGVNVDEKTLEYIINTSEKLKRKKESEDDAVARKRMKNGTNGACNMSDEEESFSRV